MKTNTEPVATTRTAELMARQFDEARKLKDGLPREEIAAAWIDLAMELESALQAERDKLRAELAALKEQVEAAALLAAAKEPQGDGWIKCSERLPDDGQEVIAATKDGRIVFERWMMRHESPVSWSSATMPVGMEWDDHDFDEVTHWQPLPPLPKE